MLHKLVKPTNNKLEMVRFTDRIWLGWIVGKRAFLAFGLVTMMVVALLAATNFTSRYALKTYVDKQLSRIPWDVTVYQVADINFEARISRLVKELPEVRRAETFFFLRALMPDGVDVIIDNKPVRTSWISLLAATDRELLPPETRISHKGSTEGAVLALIGPERHMGNAFKALQGTKKLEIAAELKNPDGQSPRNQQKKETRTLLTSPLERVVRVERDELNRWLMDRVGSISFIPYIGLMLSTTYDPDMVKTFDLLAQGIVEGGLDVDIHARSGGYLPEAIHLIQGNRDILVSGWDIERSRHNIAVLQLKVRKQLGKLNTGLAGSKWVHVEAPHPGEEHEESEIQLKDLYVASDSLVMLDSMARVAKLLGILTILIAIPLLWMAWALARNLTSLLMLNERYLIGLLRLRGTQGRIIGQSFITAIGLGGLFAGILGIALGTVIPSLVYEGHLLSWDILKGVQNPAIMLFFLIVGMVFTVAVSRRLVSYATSITAREAASRLAASEEAQLRIGFGPWQLVILLLGSYRIGAWVSGWGLSSLLKYEPLKIIENLLDFVALPFFIYGFITLVVSRQQLLRRLIYTMVTILRGRLEDFTLKHLAAKPHRIISLLLIAALASGISLYPPIAASSFEEKAFRGTRAQMGTELNLTLNAPELVEGELKGGLGAQISLLKPNLNLITEKATKIPGVVGILYIYEAILPQFYMPGYGLTGVSLYSIDDPNNYIHTVYSEDAIGKDFKFSRITTALNDGKVAISPTIADFFDIKPGEKLFIGVDTLGEPVVLPAAGAVHILPGIPKKSIQDRDSYVAAEVEYLNYLFNNTAFVAAAADNANLSSLRVLIPRISLLVSVAPGADLMYINESLMSIMPSQPLEVRYLPGELEKTGQDIYISLTLANLRVYLLGSLLLAIIAIISIALANYIEDRRTLGLLRLRGASPMDIIRFFSSSLLSPIIFGLFTGALIGIIGGYGFSNLIWSLRKIMTVVMFLPTHLVMTVTIALILIIFLVVFSMVSLIFGIWVFRRTARESL